MMMKANKREELDLKARCAIQLSLANEVLREVAKEELGSMYMTKSLTNRLYLKQRLYTLRMREGMFVKVHVD